MYTSDHEKPGTGMQPLAVTIPEAVRLSGLSRSELYRQMSAGRIRARKSGSRTLVVWASLQDHVESLPQAEFRAPKAAA
jgi:predicted DNA-binding transcriptional regulator AlpA